MAAVNPPFAIQDQVHASDIFRRMVRAVRVGQGVSTSADMAVAQHAGTPGMSVDVAAGVAVVDGTQDVVHQGSYVCLNDATVQLTIAAADPTNPRIDIVVAKVQDSQYSGATDAWSLAVVTGTPAPSPAVPAAPANSIVLAQVSVLALAASIVNANITDVRPSSAAPAGNLGYVQATTVFGTFTALTDIPGLTKTVTVGSGRRIKITASCGLSSSVGADEVSLQIYEGATLLNATWETVAAAAGGNKGAGCIVIAVVQPSAGAHTYKVSAVRSGGTGLISTLVDPTFPGFLEIEDIGT